MTVSGQLSHRAEQVVSLIDGDRFRQVNWVEQTGSTNADLLAAGRKGAPEQARIADHQTAGRGRRDRVWLSPPDAALMMSVLVRRGLVAARLFDVTMAMGLAALDAIAEVAAVQAALKWPNDVLVDERKLAGVLAESALGAEPMVVVGIGLNVREDAVRDLPPEVAQRATFLGAHAALDPDVRPRLAAAMLGSLERWLDGPAGDVLGAYRNRSATIGQNVVVARDNGEPLRGVATAVTPRGELVVRADGVDHTLTVGDVSHVRPGSE